MGNAESRIIFPGGWAILVDVAIEVAVKESLPDVNKPWKAMSFVGLVGLDLSVFTIGGFWLGRFADRKLDTEPAFLITGVLLGLAIGVYSIYRMVQAFFGEGHD